MPYKRVGNRIYKRVGKRWRLKQRCQTVASARAAMQLLRAIEHGWRPTGKRGRRK